MKAIIENVGAEKKNKDSSLKKGKCLVFVHQTRSNFNVSINFPYLIRRNFYIEYDNNNLMVHPGYSEFFKGDANVNLRLPDYLDLQQVKPQLKGKKLRITIPIKVEKSNRLYRKAA